MNVVGCHTVGVATTCPSYIFYHYSQDADSQDADLPGRADSQDTDLPGRAKRLPGSSHKVHPPRMAVGKAASALQYHASPFPSVESMFSEKPI